MFPSAAVDDGRPKFRELRKGNARFAAEARDGRSHPIHLGNCEGPIQLMETLKKKSMISQSADSVVFASQNKESVPNRVGLLGAPLEVGCHPQALALMPFSQCRATVPTPTVPQHPSGRTRVLRKMLVQGAQSLGGECRGGR